MKFSIVRAKRGGFSHATSGRSTVMDIYLRFVNAWYTKEFIEIFLAPRDVLGLPPAVNAVLGGNIGNSFAIRWRMWVFYFLVWLQQRYPIVPRLKLVPKKEDTISTESAAAIS